LDRRLGGPQSRSGRGGEEKNSHALLGLEPPIIQPIAQRYATELSRLQLLLNNLKKHEVVMAFFGAMFLQSFMKIRHFKSY
jgi:hypothetical protein